MRFDPQTGNIVDTPAAPVNYAAQLGIPAAVASSDQIPMLDPAGKPVFIKAAELKQAAENGYTYESPEAEAARKRDEKYGGVGGVAAASAAGAARTLSFGGSDVAARIVGLDKDLKELKEANPRASTAGEVGGGIAGMFIPGSPAVRLAEGANEAFGVGKAGSSLASQILTRAGSDAVQGAAYGLGQGVSDQALGSNESIAESLLENAGMGFVLGGGTSLALSGLGLAAKGAQKGLSKAQKLLSGGEKGAEAAADAAAPGAAGLSAAEVPTPEAPPTMAPGGGVIEFPPAAAAAKEAQAPSSIEEIMKRQEDLKKFGGLSDELPAADRLREIEQNLPDFQSKPHAIHYEIVSSPENFDKMRVLLHEMPGPERQAMQSYDNQAMREIENKSESLITQLGDKPRVDRAKSGQQLMEEFKNTYDSTKKEVGKLFRVIDEVKAPAGHMADLGAQVAEVAPAFSSMIQATPEGELKILPFDSKLGISKTEYSVAKQVIKDLGTSEDVTVRQLQRAREFIRKSIDPSNPAETSNLIALRKAMLNHIERVVEAVKPDANIRQAFTRWAKNEAFLENTERMLGGSIDDLNRLAFADPDKVLSKVFRNQNTVQFARDLLGEARFGNLTGDYVQDLYNKAFDSAKNELQPGRWRTLLEKERDVLLPALGEQKYQRLVDMADYGKFLGLMRMVNPSGTAKTSFIMGLGDSMKKAAHFDFVGAAKQLGITLEDRINARRAVQTVDEVLKGNKAAAQAHLETRDRVVQSLKEFFNREAPAARKATQVAAVVGGLSMDRDDYQKRFEKLQEMITEPQRLTDAVTGATRNFAKVNPTINDAIVEKSMRAAQFLYDKAPKPPAASPLDGGKYHPSDAELARWNRYVKAVENPVSIIKEMNAGVLTPEGVEAVRTVYPELYSKISQMAIEMASKKRDSLSYSDKVMLSMLLQQPMTQSMRPDFIQSLQQPQASDAPTGVHGRKPALDGASRAQSATSKILTR